MIKQEKVDPWYRLKCIMMLLKKKKTRLLNPLLLHLSDNRGRFWLFSDTTKIATGLALYQFQNDTTILAGFQIKRLPPAAAVYYLNIELEWLGLCVNMRQFKHLLQKVDFDYTVDNLALTYIMKSKTELINAE